MKDYRFILTKLAQTTKHPTGGMLAKYGLRVLHPDHPEYNIHLKAGQIDYKQNPHKVLDYANKNNYKLTDKNLKAKITEKAAQAMFKIQGFEVASVGGRWVNIDESLNSLDFNHPTASGEGKLADVTATKYDHGGMKVGEDQVGEGKTTIGHVEVKYWPSTFSKGVVQAQKIQTKAAEKNKWIGETSPSTSTDTAPGGHTVVIKKETTALVGIPKEASNFEFEQLYMSTNFENDAVLEIDGESQEAASQFIRDVLSSV